MNKAKKMDSCRDLFKSTKILPLYTQYIFSLFNACGEQKTYIYKKFRSL